MKESIKSNFSPLSNGEGARGRGLKHIIILGDGMADWPVPSGITTKLPTELCSI